MENIFKKSQEIFTLLKNKGVKLSTAESCTGGMIASAITSCAGSSMVFDRGFVTYSNNSKKELLGVNTSTLDDYGAVSEETCLEMAEGALRNSEAYIAISVTGIAGPDGGTEEKPVGLVYIGFATKIGGEEITVKAYKNLFRGDRNSIREQTVLRAFNIIQENIK